MKRSHIIWALGCLLVGAISFLVGTSVGERAMLKPFSLKYSSVQAMLAFNRLQDDRH